MPHAEDEFHLGIKAIIRNAEGQILLFKVNTARLKSNKHGAYWDLPGGRVQRGSSVEDTLRREIEEETGLTDIIAMRPFAMTLSPLRIPGGTKAAGSPHDVGLVLSAYVVEVADAGPIRLSDEHTDYAWYAPSDAASMLGVKYPAEFTDRIRSLTSASGQRTASIGCEAYIVRDGQLLLGLRKAVFGAGTWALPGGHLEFMERADYTIARELREETGLRVDPAHAKLLAVTDSPSPDPGRQTHYIHLTFGFDVGHQDAQLLEPEACAEWRWWPINQLPKLFPPHADIIANIQERLPYGPQLEGADNPTTTI